LKPNVGWEHGNSKTIKRDFLKNKSWKVEQIVSLPGFFI